MPAGWGDGLQEGGGCSPETVKRPQLQFVYLIAQMRRHPLSASIPSGPLIFVLLTHIVGSDDAVLTHAPRQHYFLPCA